VGAEESEGERRCWEIRSFIPDISIAPLPSPLLLRGIQDVQH